MEKWYTIEKTNQGWTVWENTEVNYGSHGGYGCRKIFSSPSRQECIDYCKENDLKVSRVK